ncbi:MAG: DUF433 domain-containing protein [Nitrospirota bacterium]
MTIDPKVFGGKPCIRGLRFPVSKILDLLAAGMSQEEILSDYPYLKREDIVQADNSENRRGLIIWPRLYLI